MTTSGAASPLNAELAARWRYLKKRFGPVLPPQTLALVLALAVSLVFSGLLQFGTGVFERWPALSILLAAVNGALALAVAGLLVLVGRWGREQIAVAVVMGLVVLLSAGSVMAKLHYQRSLTGNPFYALPHQPTGYPKSAKAVTLRTADGVTLEGTLLGPGSPRAILVYPTWRTDREAFSIATLALWLGNDFDVLVIDPRGQGDSGGAKSPDGSAKQDVVAAVAYLRETGHRKIGVLAEQDAAYPVVLAAAMQPGLDSVALVAPSYSWGESLGQTGRMWDPRGLAGRLYWRVVAGLRLTGGTPGPAIGEAIAQVAPTPVLLLGHRSGVGTQVDRLHERAQEPKSLMILPGEENPVGWAYFGAYYQAISEWFELSLRLEAPTEAIAPAAPLEEAAPAIP